MLDETRLLVGWGCNRGNLLGFFWIGMSSFCFFFFFEKGALEVLSSYTFSCQLLLGQERNLNSYSPMQYVSLKHPLVNLNIILKFTFNLIK